MLVALAGGNEFRANCVEMDRDLLGRIARQPARVVVLPTAAVRGSPRMAADNGVRHFRELGAQASAAMIITRQDADDPVKVAQLQDADLIYLAGGDPWYLLETLRDSQALAAIRERLDAGALLAGSSAGAMILAQKMVTDGWDSWTDALGVVPGIGIIPHHNSGVRTLNALTRAAVNEKIAILGIDEATACVSGGDATWQVVGIGSVTVYAADQMQSYPSGQHFRIRP